MVLYFDPLQVLDGEMLGNLLPYSSGNECEVAWFNVALFLLIAAVCFLWWWRFVYVGLRHYLRLDHRNAVALFLSTQMIGSLVLILALCRSERVLSIIGGWLR